MNNNLFKAKDNTRTRIHKVGDGGLKVNIPAKVRDTLGICRASEVEWVITDDGRVEIVVTNQSHCDGRCMKWFDRCDRQQRAERNRLGQTREDLK